jgi:phage N-6-adenine-methyltransferase
MLTLTFGCRHIVPMSNNLIVTEPVPPEKFVATLENVGAELARITASLAQALTLPPLDALQQLRKTERRAEWLHHGVRSAARSARFYLVWQNRFAGERFKCMRAIGKILIALLRHKGGRPRKTLSDAEGFPILEALFGRDAYNFSAECQAIARMPKEVFDAYLLTGETGDDVDDRNPQAPELSKAGLLRWGERYFESDNRSPFGPDPSGGSGQASPSDGYAGSPVARARNRGRWHSHGRDWATPQELYDELNEEFHFTLDVAASDKNAKHTNYFTEEQDALKQDWGKNNCFMNCPYGEGLNLWMKKAFESAQQGATVVCLVPAGTGTAWWNEYAVHGEIRYIRGRPKFLMPEGTWQQLFTPSVIVVFRPPTATANDDIDPHFDVDRLNIEVCDIDLYEKSQTNPAMARLIVEHFNPKGRILESSDGEGAFSRAFPENETLYRCEITEGSNFFDFNEKVDWIIGNWPYALYNEFARHSFELADNVVNLAHIGSVLTKARIRDFLSAGHGLKEIFSVDNEQAGFPGGMGLAAFHWQRGWTGPVVHTYLNPPSWYVPARWVIVKSVRGVFGCSAATHGRVPSWSVRGRWMLLPDDLPQPPSKATAGVL